MDNEEVKPIHPIKKLRKKLKKNQVEFCKIMGVKQGTLSKIERGLLIPTLTNVHNMKLVIKTSIGLCRFIDEIISYEYNSKTE